MKIHRIRQKSIKTLTIFILVLVVILLWPSDQKNIVPKKVRGLNINNPLERTARAKEILKQKRDFEIFHGTSQKYNPLTGNVKVDESTKTRNRMIISTLSKSPSKKFNFSKFWFSGYEQLTFYAELSWETLLKYKYVFISSDPIIKNLQKKSNSNAQENTKNEEKPILFDYIQKDINLANIEKSRESKPGLDLYFEQDKVRLQPDVAYFSDEEKEHFLNKERNILKDVTPNTFKKRRLVDGFGNLISDPHPKGNEIVLVSVILEDDSEKTSHYGKIYNFFEKIKTNRDEYCVLHQYTHMFINMTGNKPSEGYPDEWYKIEAIVKAMELHPEAEWIWYLDPSAIIMNPDVDLASWVLHPSALAKRITYGKRLRNLKGGYTSVATPDLQEGIKEDSIDFIISQDDAGISLGSYFIRNTKFSKLFFDLIPVVYQGMKNARLEELYLHLFTNHNIILSRAAFVTQRVMNSYPLGDEMSKYNFDDLAVYLSDCWKKDSCVAHFQRLWRERKPAILSGL